MPRPPLTQPLAAGAVAAVTGFASSFVLVLAGLAAVGATPAQAASGLLALCLVQCALAVVLSRWTRLPLSFVWSTPGAALLVAAEGRAGSLGAAVGAFLLSALLVVVTGAWPALARLVRRVPTPVAGALLAGVLLPLCLAPVSAVRADPVAGLAVAAVWLVLRRVRRAFAVPAAMLVALAFTAAALPGTATLEWVPRLVPVAPELDPSVVVSLGVPLYVVTMAGQNIPGFTILETLGHRRVPTGRVLVGAGLGSGAAAVFGGHAVNLSALAAGIIAGPGAGKDPSRRWIAAVAGGAGYLVLGLLAAPIAGLVGSTDPVLVEAVAGLALLDSFVGGLVSALDDAGQRVTAALTFVVVASGVSFAGVGSAFWGLLVGLLVFPLARPARPAASA
ncbi:benzoate/H(+) symporter BenE family transporter [Kineococcus radiotolerans]|uniref:benzoate/H(+) symporter BenE family transporter n=1 Tax=Kineococcus radiotolerans TaxID=131568 RepID=UPI0002DDF0F9|nr:benzoate/H(+) symporter BenE family transporter [Kineococcus radiotolerans]